MPQVATAPQTHFLPAERAPAAQLAHQHDLVARQVQLGAVLDAVPQPMAVINAQRQIVHLNEAARQMLGVGSASDLAGARPGEALGCEVAARAPGGCGTAVACCDCGAVLSVLEARRRGRGDRTCTISRGSSAMPLDLQVASRLIDVEGEPFILATLTDVHHERRRRILERLFFHDVLNTAGGLRGLSEANLATLETDPAGAAELARLLVQGCHQLVEEITAQRDLAAAEAGELEVRTETVDAADILADVARTYGHHPVAAGRTLAVPAGPSADLQTDPGLLGRVLGNLVKNALEAVPRGGEVTLAHAIDADHVAFRVGNPGEVPRHVRRHLFERSVSTKGAGRGLGTYSVRLLTEVYLGGTVSWFSDARRGTCVTIRIPRRQGRSARSSDAAGRPRAA